MSTGTAPPLMTYQQAAQIYGFKYQTLRHYASKGRLHVVRALDGRPMLSHAAMRAYLQARSGRGYTMEMRKGGN